MTQTVVGIDPGVSGALVALDLLRNAVIHATPMPVLTDRNGKSLVDAAGVLRFLLDARAAHVYLEQVNAMPARGKGGEARTMGATSAFNFGRGFGVLEGVAACAQVPVTYVAPATWKKRAGLIGTEKDFARTAALRLFPAAGELLRRKKDIGIADAMLIARYGGT